MKNPFRVLFICTGNSCRSPMAEVLLRKQLADQGFDQNVEVSSAGISAMDGFPASDGACQAIKKRGASLDYFQSRLLTSELCAESNLLLVMEAHQKDYIEEYFPLCSDKTQLLGSYLFQNGAVDISDPVGGDPALFNRIADLLEQAISQIVQEWPTLIDRFYENKRRVIAIGADHRGYAVKEFIKPLLHPDSYTVMDCGTHTPESCDHPDYAFIVSELVASGQADRGILVCATGHGMLLSANKVPGIRAVLAINEEHAKLSRDHNNANVLTLGADFIDRETIEKIITVWLQTDFLGGRYQKRINKISNYERSLRC